LLSETALGIDGILATISGTTLDLQTKTSAKTILAFGLGEGSGFNFGWTFTNTVTWKETFGKDAFDVILGTRQLVINCVQVDL